MKRTALLFLSSLFAFSSSAGFDGPLVDRPCEGSPVTCFPFPDAVSAFVWRNWSCVPVGTMAEILGTDPGNVSAMAVEMGLPPQGGISPLWRTKGYITLLRRNWHLLPYDQLVRLLGLTREELSFRLLEDDFLFGKLGGKKPICPRLTYDAEAAKATRAARRELKEIIAAEELDLAAQEEPRFAFLDEMARVDPAFVPRPADSDCAFPIRYIFSYFCDYVAPLDDAEVRSFPEGLLQKLQRQGVNGVWLHVVLRTLAKDPRYPEFGEGCERRMANLRTLIGRCGKYGIKVYLYLNEPRGLTGDFFEKDPARRALRGVYRPIEGRYALCTSEPETLRWLGDAVGSVFRAAPGLGGILTISASENLTSCASLYLDPQCPRCSKRNWSEMIAEVNRTMIDAMHGVDPSAKAFVWNWSWDGKSLFSPRTREQQDSIVPLLPKDNVYLMTTSEIGMPFERGGIANEVNEYCLSVPGPSGESRHMWGLARRAGLVPAAKVQASSTWELSPFPYVPAMDLVARHAVNLAAEGVGAVMMSWTLGSAPAPNLRIFGCLRKGDSDIDPVLNRLAAELYGKDRVPLVRKAWQAFSRGYAEYPYDLWALYRGPQQMGPANPLYPQRTGYKATMVCFPYDDLDSWRSLYPAEIWIRQMDRVADGFEDGCQLFKRLIDELPEDGRISARRELFLFRAEGLHFRSCANQGRYVLARNSGSVAAQASVASAEKSVAKQILPCVRADSRIGYECSNHYYYLPLDIVEKIIGCSKLEKGLVK